MQHLRDLRYWSKGLAIFLWSLYLTVYLFLFKQIEPEKTNNLNTFIGLAISVLIGGTWWNFITNLYNTPRNDYDHKYFFAALSVLLILGSAIWVLSLRDPHEFNPCIQCCNSSYPASVYSGARYCATVLL